MLSGFLFYEALLPASGNGGGGVTVLKRYGYDEDNVFPAGILGENAYYRLWEDTPTFSEMTGAVFSGSQFVLNCVEISEGNIIDLSVESGLPVYAVNFGELFPILVIMEDFESDEIVFRSGIYVEETQIHPYDLSVLVCNIPTKGA